MVTLAFEHAFKVLLARFSGIHVPEDIADLEQAIMEIVGWGEHLHGVLLDYTAVEAVAMPQSFIAYRASLPLMSTGYERVMVVPNQELYGLARAYATQQREYGYKAPHVVASTGDAYELLRLQQPNFQPISFEVNTDRHQAAMTRTPSIRRRTDGRRAGLPWSVFARISDCPSGLVLGFLKLV
jgi:hypothetical protein